jgi:thiol-disulfide isomerase/thioredoxin
MLISLFPFLLIAAEVSQNAPDFSFDQQHGSVSLKQLKGKVVLLDFWASWCAPCRRSFPWMNEMYKKYHPLGLEIVAVNLDEERSDAENFLKKNKADFKIAYDPQSNLANQYGLDGMPSSYLINTEGVVVNTHMGFFNSKKEQMELEIRQALNL